MRLLSVLRRVADPASFSKILVSTFPLDVNFPDRTSVASRSKETLSLIPLALLMTEKSVVASQKRKQGLRSMTMRLAYHSERKSGGTVPARWAGPWP